MALPTGRHALAQPGSPGEARTYGHYFSAVRSYLEGEGRAVITAAADRILHRPVTVADIQGFDIHLVKHGALYHPSLVTVRINDDFIPLALNVAASEDGCRVIRREYDLLQRLNLEFPTNFIPIVYGRGQGCPGSGQPGMETMEMFLAQWFEGFCEFHISDTPKAGRHWRIWDDVHGHRDLIHPQIEELFRQAARILTHYLNPVSFEAVLDWHHAAGDFVLRPNPHGVEVRLVTVRRYAPFLQWQVQEAPGVEELLEALTLFLLRTSLWLRMDRLDGVGELVWADGLVLGPIWQGFVQGLNAMAEVRDLPVELVQAAVAYVAAHSNRDMAATCTRMVDQWVMASPEKQLIRHHLSAHIEALMAAVRGGQPGTASNGLMTL